MFVEIDQLQKKDNIKEELDTKIKTVLKNSFSLVLTQLQEIPPSAALLLHGYCDNYMAPFKQSVIILTAFFGSKGLKNEKEVIKQLHRLWDPELGIDKSSSIVSRVANILLFVQPEASNLSCL